MLRVKPSIPAGYNNIWLAFPPRLQTCHWRVLCGSLNKLYSLHLGVQYRRYSLKQKTKKRR